MVENADLAILTFITAFAGKSSMFDRFVSEVSQLDLFKGVALMCLFWFAWATATPEETRRHQDERHEKLVNVLIASLVIGALSRGLQHALHVHTRPLLSDLHLPFPIEAGTWGLSTWNSFPSDHAMLFFALSTGLFTVNRRVGTLAFIWSLVVIALPRMYLGIHYPSDIIGGAILGSVCMLGIQQLFPARLNTTVSRWRNSHQGAFIAMMFLVTHELSHLLDEFRQLANSTAKIIFTD